MTPVGDNQFNQEILACLSGDIPQKIGVAASGGGDSTALLSMLAQWGREHDVIVEAVTVNHGLRPAALDEVATVANLCRNLGLAHQIINWDGWQGTGNLQDAARRARLDLISDWAIDRNIGAVALGHTLDDQAETVLMRLVRGSGVDGLSAMNARRTDENITWLRPLLTYRRQALRDYLQAENLSWSDDPSNEDDRFDRVKTRKALVVLESIGLTPEGLAQTASRFQVARSALEHQTHQAVHNLANVTRAGDVELDASGFINLADETQRRLMAHSLRWVGSNDYRPRLSALLAMMADIETGQRASLAGCLITPEKSGVIRVAREPNAAAKCRCLPGEMWDGRWLIENDAAPKGCFVAALGEKGLAECPDWRSSELPRDSLRSTPGIWQNHRLIAAPVAGWPQGWSCNLQKAADRYYTSLLSH